MAVSEWLLQEVGPQLEHRELVEQNSLRKISMLAGRGWWLSTGC